MGATVIRHYMFRREMCVEVRAFANGPLQVFPAGRAISAEGGVAVHRGADHVELPRLARPKGCFVTSAAWNYGTHYGPTRMHVPTRAYAIGGTATLALRYSIISTTAAARTLPPGRLRAGKGCWGWSPPPLPPGPQDLPRDYGPDGAAGGLKPEYTAPSGPRVRPNPSGSF